MANTQLEILRMEINASAKFIIAFTRSLPADCSAFENVLVFVLMDSLLSNFFPVLAEFRAIEMTG